MISCQKCEFKILPKMRFALVKNFCPSCGGTLLSDLDSQEINAINRKLQAQEFMVSLSNQLNKDLVQTLIYDLSIFIKFDLQKEQSRAFAEFNSQEESPPSLTSEGDEDRPRKNLRPISRAESSGQPQPVHSRDIQAFRKAIVGDDDGESDDMEDLEDEPSDDEDSDDRVKRLKKVYASSPTLKKFGGISRSE